MLELNGENFNEIVVDSPNPQVVWFTAKWCVPCKALGPQIVGASIAGGFSLVKVDVDTLDMETIRKYNVGHVPTVLVFQNGAPVGEITARHRNGILEQLEALGV